MHVFRSAIKSAASFQPVLAVPRSSNISDRLTGDSWTDAGRFPADVSWTSVGGFRPPVPSASGPPAGRAEQRL